MNSLGRDCKNMKEMVKRVKCRREKLMISDEEMIKKLRRGDHICAGRMNNLYQHHGIYVGEESEGKHRVIHLQGPHKVTEHSEACKDCGYEPQRDGIVVKTCVKCFCGDHSLRKCEYGIRVSDPVVENLVSDAIIYTYRKGSVYLGRWTERNTVSHLTKPQYSQHGFAMCQTCAPQNNSNFVLGMLETCLKCFLSGGLLYINDHGLHIPSSDIKAWISKNKALESDDNPDLINQHAAETSYILQNCPKKLTLYKLFHCASELNEKLVGLVFKLINLNVKNATARSGVFPVYKNNRVQVYEHDPMRSGDEVVEEANRCLQDKSGKYNFLTNNCEHFAFFCKTGIAQSIQVARLRYELINLQTSPPFFQVYIFAITASTTALESAFSLGSRVRDSFRAARIPKMAAGGVGLSNRLA